VRADGRAAVAGGGVGDGAAGGGVHVHGVRQARSLQWVLQRHRPGKEAGMHYMMGHAAAVAVTRLLCSQRESPFCFVAMLQPLTPSSVWSPAAFFPSTGARARAVLSHTSFVVGPRSICVAVVLRLAGSVGLHRWARTRSSSAWALRQTCAAPRTATPPRQPRRKRTRRTSPRKATSPR